VNVKGAAPFVFFDQKTARLRWGDGDVKGEVTIWIQPSDDAANKIEVRMPTCHAIR